MIRNKGDNRKKRNGGRNEGKRRKTEKKAREGEKGIKKGRSLNLIRWKGRGIVREGEEN